LLKVDPDSEPVEDDDTDEYLDYLGVSQYRN
jgi:hypothetical protein